MSDEEYEEATPEQKLDIATYFIMSSPTGEVEDVIGDVTNLVNDSDIMSKENLANILADYNTTQMNWGDNLDHKKVLVTVFGQVDKDLFLDPASGRVFKYDHRNAKFDSETDKKQVLNDTIAAQRAATETAVAKYMTNNYSSGKCVCAVYGNDDGNLSICLSAKNTKLSSFWSGSWRGVYTVNVSTAGSVELTGNIKVNVHYFEDGNVQLNTTFSDTIKVDISEDVDASAKEIVEAIGTIEGDYQKHMEEMFVDMHRTTFKQMRRFLPINKQPMNWNIAAHNIASEMS